jgi:hypothetical protein
MERMHFVILPRVLKYVLRIIQFERGVADARIETHNSLKI